MHTLFEDGSKSLIQLFLEHKKLPMQTENTLFKLDIFGDFPTLWLFCAYAQQSNSSEVGPQ